ncbi:MAG: hypothetical protein ACEQSB_06440 [Undibacterium sp.]
MSKTIQTIIRIILSILLLLVVWGNAHWSVALCLTLIMIRNEIHDAIYR